jgi:SnoaL-like domain
MRKREPPGPTDSEVGVADDAIEIAQQTDGVAITPEVFEHRAQQARLAVAARRQELYEAPGTTQLRQVGELLLAIAEILSAQRRLVTERAGTLAVCLHHRPHDIGPNGPSPADTPICDPCPQLLSPGRVDASGDRRHLLPVGEHQGVRIVTPQALLAELAGEGSPRDDPALSNETEKLLRRAYEAFNDRDIEGALATMHPDVDWPNGMEGGRLHGHQEVRAYRQHQFTSIDSRVDPQRIEPGPDGRIVVTVRQLVRDRAGNIVSDEPVEHHYLIAEGLVKRMDIHTG